MWSVVMPHMRGSKLLISVAFMTIPGKGFDSTE